MYLNSKNESPTGRWRDGLFGCFNNGPVCCMTWCCLPVILGQVMTRMSRNWCGGPGSAPSTSNTCTIVALMGVLVVMLVIIMSVVWRLKVNACLVGEYQNVILVESQDCVNTLRLIQNISLGTFVLAGIFGIYIRILACRTRGRIRENSDIPDSCCGCGDCCASWWCLCCTVGQMARHTNYYDDYPVGCCSADCCFSRTGKNSAARALDV